MKKLAILSISALLAALMVTGCASKPKATASTESKKRVIYVSRDGFSKNLIEVVVDPTAERDSAFSKASAEEPVDLMAFYIAQTETTYARWYEVYTSPCSPAASCPARCSSRFSACSKRRIPCRCS